jgi:hypothetical protein
MMNIRINKVAATIIGVAFLLALSAGVTVLVANHINARSLAVQRAAATATHNRAVASAKAQAQNEAIAAANRKADNAARDARQAKQAANKRAAVQPAPLVVPGQPAPAGLTACDTGTRGEEVFAGSATSCSFALNVEQAYAQSGAWYQPGTSQFYAYSPVTGSTYLMTSSSVGNPVVVTGENNALVEFNY